MKLCHPQPSTLRFYSYAAGEIRVIRFSRAGRRIPDQSGQDSSEHAKRLTLVELSARESRTSALAMPHPQDRRGRTQPAW
jgi:hypothetical protein